MTGIAKTHSPDYILYNGNFITMNPEQEHCNIITIQDGKITGTLIPMQKASVGDFTAA